MILYANQNRMMETCLNHPTRFIHGHRTLKRTHAQIIGLNSKLSSACPCDKYKLHYKFEIEQHTKGSDSFFLKKRNVLHETAGNLHQVLGKNRLF